MTDNNSMTNSVSQSTGTLVHTVRRSEIIQHLTNFRVEVDKAIHALPGILMGVSCAGVIQASIHLNWHIEHLRGNLIEAMLRDGYNPLGEINEGVLLTPESNNTPINPIRGPELSRPQRREQVYTQPPPGMNEYSSADIRSTSTTQQTTSQDYQANQIRQPAAVNRNNQASSDQVVPTNPFGGLTNGYSTIPRDDAYLSLLRDMRYPQGSIPSLLRDGNNHSRIDPSHMYVTDQERANLSLDPSDSNQQI